MKFSTILAIAAAQGALAFPSALRSMFEGEGELEHELETRQKEGCTVSAACDRRVDIPDSAVQVNQAGAQMSKARDNCGFATPCTTFNAKEQFVSIKGVHRYIAPKANQIRGPCPGLNAAANHAYLPRSGVASIPDTITGLAALYGMGPDLSGFLAAYAVVFDGDILTQTWSIGGPPPVLPGLPAPQGLSYSHNKYEGDSSIGRCDAYLNGGDAHSLSLTRFKYAFEVGRSNNRYTFDKFAFEFAKNTQRSVKTNPYYFAPLFSTTLVSPAAYNFVIAFMSNHTARTPGGYLDAYQFKQFFAVTGTYPNFKWLPGQERVPENWYRRPSSAPYKIPDVFADLLPEFLAYPQSFRFGGNTNGVNTYTGVNLTDFSQGAVNGQNIFKGNNFACFVYQNIQQGAPDQLQGGFNPLQDALKLLNSATGNAFKNFNCPQVKKFKTNTLDGYTGHNYSPKGPANTC